MRRFLAICLLLVNLPLLAESEPRSFSFMSYNLKNYLWSDTFSNGKKSGQKYKPENEIEALVDIISSEQPDILGLCEIGTLVDLADLKGRLATRGINYPHQEYVPGADSVRHLALLSKYPITERLSRSDLNYTIGNHRFPLRRGVLHVVIDIEGQTFHAIGAHLKSKRPSQDVDESEMRLKEAYLVRAEITKTLSNAPDTNLLVYGDFNDFFKSNTIDAIKGHYRSKTRITPIDLTDSNGTYWTHFWKWQRKYSLFDYMFCNKELMRKVNLSKSSILEGQQVLEASDHRPLLVIFDL